MYKYKVNIIVDRGNIYFNILLARQALIIIIVDVIVNNKTYIYIQKKEIINFKLTLIIFSKNIDVQKCSIT